MGNDRAVILFDGVCNLCSGFVRFVIKRDRAGRFQFASLDSHAALRVMANADAHDDRVDSIVLVEDGYVYMRSAAALRIARGLRFPWPLAYLFVLVPRPLRDLVYDIVARRRYQWFGRRSVCMVPTPELRGRFLQ